MTGARLYLYATTLRDGAQTQGVDFSAEDKRAIAEARRVTESKLAELEILHRDQMAKLGDPVKRAEQEEFYRREHESIERDGEARVEKIRRG